MTLAVAEWIEDATMAGAPLASYAANHQETYRDPQTGPPVPNAMGQKRKFSAIEVKSENSRGFLFLDCVTQSGSLRVKQNSALTVEFVFLRCCLWLCFGFHDAGTVMNCH